MFSKDRYASEYFSSQTQSSYTLGTLLVRIAVW